MVDGIIRLLEYITHNPIFQGTMIGLAVIAFVIVALIVWFFIAVMIELFGKV
jgi:hypothetical protein